MKRLKESIKFIESYGEKTHTEDCLDANDDTSVLKGECLCSTPVPWKVHEGVPNQIVTSEENFLIAEIDTGFRDEDKVNAAYIVKCVNAHEELLEVLKAFEERIEKCDDCDGTGKEDPEDACGRCGGQGHILENGTALISDLEQAIAKAEGR